MKLLRTSALAIAMLTLGIASVSAQTADEILEKHANAIGGLENWNKLKTFKATGTMTSQGMEISIGRTMEFGKAARMDISVMGMTGFIILTENEGYSYMPFTGATKIDTMKSDAVKGQKKQLDMKSQQLLDYKTSGSKWELAGKNTINNSACYKIKMTEKDGTESMEYIDCTSYYLMRTETKVKKDDEEQEIAIVYGNYQKQDGGVVLPMTMTPQGQEITWKSIELNKPIDKNIFKPVIAKAENKEPKK